MNCCIICYKQTSHEERKEDLQGRFFRLLKRHVDYGRIKPPLENEMGSCQDCYMLMDSFCQLYHDMKLAQLQLNKKLWTITNIMKSGGKVKSRIKELRENFMKLKESEDAQECIDWIIKFQNNLIKKCSAKLIGSTPRLIISKYVGPLAIECHEGTRLETQPIKDVQNWNILINQIHSSIKTELYVEQKPEFSNIISDKEAGYGEHIEDEEEILIPKLEILTQTIAIPNLTQTLADSATDYSHNLEDDIKRDNSSKNYSNYQSENPASPVIAEIIETKLEDFYSLRSREAKLCHSKTKLKKRITCDICGKCFGAIKLLKSHKINFHQGNNLFQCRICKEKFQYRNQLARHFCSVHVKPRYCCEVPGCNRNYSHESKLAAHFKLDHPDFKSENPATEVIETKLKDNKMAVSDGDKECKECHKIFSSKTYLKKHFNIVHLKLRLFKCPTCRKLFSTQSFLRQHFDTVHLCKKPYKCPTCDKSFSRYSHLRRHKTIPHNHKPQIPKIFKCKKCGKAFATLKFLKMHERWVHIEKRFQCSVCDKKFAYLRLLNIHTSSVHEKQRQFCKVTGCAKSYSLKTNLYTHYRLEHPDFTFPRKVRPKKCMKYSKRLENGKTVFKCPTCLKDFNHANNLRDHINRIHLLVKPHKCDICDKSFFSPKSLRLHKATPHKPKSQVLNSKTFSCEKCGKSFSNLKSVKYHERRVHDGKKIQCIICEKKFGNRRDLKIHNSSVHEKQRHYCKVPGCDKNYSLNSTLVSHYRLGHPHISHKTSNRVDISVNVE